VDDRFEVLCSGAKVRFSFLFRPGAAAPTDVKGLIRCDRLDPITDEVDVSIGEFAFSISGKTDLKVPPGMTVDIREEGDARDTLAYWLREALKK
jgi:hypothetical protein